MPKTRNTENETIYAFTRADAEALAGRALTDEEIGLIGMSVTMSSISEALDDIVFSVAGKEGDDPE